MNIKKLPIQLKDARNKGLYKYDNAGELNQLINIVANLSDTFRKAGIRSIANEADKKLRELDKAKC